MHELKTLMNKHRVFLESNQEEHLGGAGDVEGSPQGNQNMTSVFSRNAGLTQARLATLSKIQQGKMEKLERIK